MIVKTIGITTSAKVAWSDRIRHHSNRKTKFMVR
jgi:hypothetical protein